jgi:hypothetical protein
MSSSPSFSLTPELETAWQKATTTDQGKLRYLQVQIIDGTTFTS